jgi:caffeoyl-CoA O-methyltransferase
LLTETLHRYLVEHTTPLDDVQRSLIDETAALGGIALMQVAPEQGALLTILARLIGATRAVEVGTFTGYSALCIARGLAPGGTLLCCDVNEEWTAIGQRHWKQAGVDDRITLKLGPAADTLRALPADEPFDFAFIDADKGNYVTYVDLIVERLRPGGLLLIDNVLWSGRVIDPSADDADTAAIRACNDHVASHPDLESVILPVADGLTLAYRSAGSVPPRNSATASQQ